MLLEIGTQDLNVDVLSASLGGYLLPLAPGQLDGIARVCDDAKPEPQIINYQPISQPVPFASHVDRAQLP